MNFKKRFATILAIAGVATLTIHITNKIIAVLSTMDNNLKSDRGNYFDWRFGKIFYRSEGKGSPILLIHDLETYSSAYEWHRTIKELSKNHKVYSIDLLGCGRSDKPTITYTNFLYVQLISDFISDIIKSKTDIIASSNSTSIALMTALYNSSLINRLLLINPNDINGIIKSPTKRNLLTKYLISAPVIGTFLYNSIFSKHNICNTLNQQYYNISSFHKSDINHLYESSHLQTNGAKFLYASIRSNFLNTNIIHALTSLDISIYIIASDITPNYLTYAEQYFKYMPSIEIFTSEDTGKYPHLENPDKFIDTINILIN